MELKRTFTGATFRKFGLFPHPQPPQIIQPTNPNDPPNFKKRGSKSVLIIGAGLAGLSAALELSERGYKVVIEEELPFIGGKLGTKKVHTSQGDFYVEHGLHMWFYQYYMCKEILERLKVTSYLRPYNRIPLIFWQSSTDRQILVSWICGISWELYLISCTMNMTLFMID
jgi:hypothetical protein